MDAGMTGPELYCLARLNGATDAEAAAAAGYAGRRPGGAREMWERVEAMRDEPTPSAKLRIEVEVLTRKLELTRSRLVEAHRWLAAALLLEAA